MVVVFKPKECKVKSVNSTGRILDFRRSYKKAVNLAVEAYDRKKSARSRLSFKNRNLMLSICSQCNLRIRKDIADAQIENKIENAPICVSCIMGTPRKPKQKLLFSKKTQEKYKEYQSKYVGTYKK